MTLFRKNIECLSAYVPGEQPQGGGWVKLNTNENPYPPSPHVVKEIQKAAEHALQLYPDPLVTRFREVAAKTYHVEPDWILPGNGSDEVLTMIIRTFVSPGDYVAFPYPSYVLYGTLAEIQGADFEYLPLRHDWSLDVERCRAIASTSKVLFVPNPNSPSGHTWNMEDLMMIRPADGVMVIDEAYGDFCSIPHRGELLHGNYGQRVIITRTFSKSYSLAGIRFGFAIAHPELISGIRKVKDSYNCDSLAIVAAIAALEDQDWMKANVEKIRTTREFLTQQLAELGFLVVPSEANFVWATHMTGQHRIIFDELKKHKILVRYMMFPGAETVLGDQCDGLRITIGTEEQMDKLITALEEIVPQLKSQV
jgi:histidinol-phosphate aminotransferase